MNTFERELRKAVSAAGREDRARYVGRAAYLELDSGLHAKLQFVTQGIADRYGALQLSAISRTRGEIDRVTVRFEDVWGGQAPYLWRCDGKTEWYGAVPTPGDMELLARQCALPGFVDSKNEEKTERNAGYLVVSHSGGGMLRQGTRKGIRRTPANRGMRAHWVVKGLDISEDVCHGMCP